MTKYTLINRPGYFGRRRDQKIAALNEAHGKGNWTLVWDGEFGPLEFNDACKLYYEVSYLEYLRGNEEALDYICSFHQVIDNAESNIHSGLDYMVQEAFSTHIQDIAIRNCLLTLQREFAMHSPIDGEQFNLLVVRGEDSNGHRFNPGQIPFYDPERIFQPSLAPGWAKPGSVEDFWQSNKWVALKESHPLDG